MTPLELSIAQSCLVLTVQLFEHVLDEELLTLLSTTSTLKATPTKVQIIRICALWRHRVLRKEGCTPLEIRGNPT